MSRDILSTWRKYVCRSTQWQFEMQISGIYAPVFIITEAASCPSAVHSHVMYDIVYTEEFTVIHGYCSWRETISCRARMFTAATTWRCEKTAGKMWEDLLHWQSARRKRKHIGESPTSLLRVAARYDRWRSGARIHHPLRLEREKEGGIS